MVVVGTHLHLIATVILVVVVVVVGGVHVEYLGTLNIESWLVGYHLQLHGKILRITCVEEEMSASHKFFVIVMAQQGLWTIPTMKT